MKLGDERLHWRFWAKVAPSPDGCWLWVGAALSPGPRGSAGYGQYRGPGATSAVAHRTAYERLVAPIPGELTLDHLCLTRSCVNPAHLEVVTRAENTRRHGGAGAAAWRRAKTHCVHGHEFTQSNTTVWRGKRQCKMCHARIVQARRANMEVTMEYLKAKYA